MDDYATSADLPEHAKENAYRVAAWLFLWDGMPKSQVARLLGRGDRTIYRWIAAWREALKEPGLFKAGDGQQTEAMLDVREERRLEVLMQRDRLTVDLLETAGLLNTKLQDATLGEDFDVLEGIREAIKIAERDEDDKTVRRLRHQLNSIRMSGGASTLKDIATALGIVTDKIIKLSEQIAPTAADAGSPGWTEEDQAAYEAAMQQGSTHESPQSEDRR